ncbi:MAG: ParB/RepB/Spo0J family partition protein [Prevotella sp.]|nr:ParB/RepB/Spo0J family partition protein [Prevotella sp.]
MELQNIDISLIEANTGQIDGLPQNPRLIKDKRFAKLVQSIKDAPEMLAMRSLITVEYKGRYVVICGNMRLAACRELGYTELPCYVLPEDTPAAKLREYTIKDNIGYGENDWDALANEWDAEELDDWGLDVWQPDANAASELDPNSFSSASENPKEQPPHICPYCGRDISKYNGANQIDNRE